MNNYGKIIAVINFVILMILSIGGIFVVLLMVPSTAELYADFGVESLPPVTAALLQVTKLVESLSFGGSIGIAFIILAIIATIFSVIASYLIGRILQGYSLIRSILYFIIIDGLLVIFSVLCVLLSVYLPIYNIQSLS